MKVKLQMGMGLGLIILFLFIAIFAPQLAPNDPNETNLAHKNAVACEAFPLGCDQLGRCELSRMLYGARYSIGVTVPMLMVLAIVALFIGCYSSYKGGFLDEIMKILYGFVSYKS